MPRQLDFPVLAGLYHAVQLGPDRLEVCNGGRSVVLTAPGKAAAILALLHGLDGSVSADDLVARHPGLDVQPLLEQLDTRGLLIDAGKPMSASPADRTAMRTAAALRGATGSPAVAARLARSTVLIAGCGPVGAATSVALAKAGIGEILLADDHVVEEGDIATCPVLTRDAFTRSRAYAVRDACVSAADVKATVVDATVTNDALTDATLVIIQAGYADTGIAAALAGTALAAGVDHLVHQQDALEFVISPVFGSGGRPCYRCMELRRQSHIAHHDEHVAYLGHRARTAPEPDAFLAAHTSVAAGLLATTALQHLTAATPQHLSGRALVLDLETSEWQREPVLEVPQCDGCAMTDDKPAAAR